MKIKFHIFGYEVANIELELPAPEPFTAAGAVDKGVKTVSKLWVRSMLK